MILLNLCQKVFCLCFPLRVLQFLVLHLGLQSILSLSLCMVRNCSNFILLHVAVQFCQHHLSKRLSLPHCVFLSPISKIRYPQVHGFISGLSILFHWSIFLFLCQYHIVLMTAALQHNMKSERLTPPAPFFLKTALAIQLVYYLASIFITF